MEWRIAQKSFMSHYFPKAFNVLGGEYVSGPYLLFIIVSWSCWGPFHQHLHHLFVCGFLLSVPIYKTGKLFIFSSLIGKSVKKISFLLFKQQETLFALFALKPNHLFSQGKKDVSKKFNEKIILSSIFATRKKI